MREIMIFGKEKIRRKGLYKEDNMKRLTMLSDEEI